MKKEGICEFGQLPSLLIDGEYYVQSLAILRMLGKMYGLYPEDAEQAYLVDMVMDATMDLTDRYWEVDPRANKPNEDELLKKYLDQYVTTFFAGMQKRLESNSTRDYIVGDKLTIADI